MYTKIILTVIALLLTVIALTPFVQPQPAMAQGSFSGVQMAVTGENTYFFDTRTGDLWQYDVNLFMYHKKLTQLGKSLANIP